jgi:hypothetical protein
MHDMRAVHLAPGEGATVKNPTVPEAFRTLGREAGMDVVGPPLAQSNPV